MLGEVLEQDLLLPQMGHHPVGINDVSETPSKDQSVEPIQNPDDFRGVFVQECLHGVPPSTKLALDIDSIHQRRGTCSFLVAAAGCGLKKAGFPDLSGKNVYHIQRLH